MVDKLSVADLLNNFKIVKILNEDPMQKTIYIHGKTNENSSEDHDAILIIERTPFSRTVVDDILNKELVYDVILQNEKYNSLNLLPKKEAGNLKAVLIYPASEKHLEKYAACDYILYRESAEDYLKITLPHIKDLSFDHQWVNNILDKKQEIEKILFEDQDPNFGFVILPDLKWNEVNNSNLYICVIFKNHCLKSIRDLTGDHILMLEKVRTTVKEVIFSCYKFNPFQLRIYFHYYPTYFHLHLHAANSSYDSPSCTLGKAHFLDDVIDNLKRNTNYYKEVNLTVMLKNKDPLFQKFKDHHKF